MQATVPGNAASETFATILSVKLPAYRGLIRRESRKVWASKVRTLFKDLGIKGVSVRTPSYSMAHSIDINLPDRVEHEIREEWQGGSHEYATCPICQERQRAMQRIEEIILAAFPDLDNRSDSMTDHFDFCLSVR